jgi:hypothetical protein
MTRPLESVFAWGAVCGVVDGVTEVGDPPVDVGEDGGVETEDVAVGEVVWDFESGGGAVGGDAEDSGGVPIIVGQTAFFAAAGAVDCESGLGVEADGDESNEKEGEDPEDSAAHG